MRLGPVVHGGLLVVALVFSYQTATRKKEASQERGTHAVWKLANLSTIILESEKKTVRIEQRTDDYGSYLWATVDRRSSRPSSTKTKPAPAVESVPHGDAGPESAPAPIEPPIEPETETIVTTREFPLGKAGDELMEQFQTLMALRKIGPIAAEGLEEFNLHEKTVSIVAIGKDQGERTLLLAGEKIYGGTDRYMLDVEKGLGYVISGKLVQPLESSESSLRLKSMHAYDEKNVKSTLVKTTAGAQVLVKATSRDAQGEHVVWEHEARPGEVDPSLGSFLDRLQKLKPTKYEPSLDASSLVHIATLRYRDKNEKSLGYLELYRQLASAQEPSEKPGAVLQTQYYIKTERTRVLGKVGRLGADRVDQDLVELFGIAPPPPPPEPVAPKPVSPTVPVAPNSVPTPPPTPLHPQ